MDLHIIDFFLTTKLNTLDDINSAHAVLSPLFNECVTDLMIGPEFIRADVLADSGYVNFAFYSDFYLHRNFLEHLKYVMDITDKATVIAFVRLLQKVAYADLYLNTPNHSNVFVNFIYTCDKFSRYTSLNEAVVFRLDGFHGGKNANSYRHQGTRRGFEAYKNYKKMLNITFLRTIAYGPGNESEPLRCAISGKPVEDSVPTLKFSHTKSSTHIFDIHHCLHDATGSHNKSQQPSCLLRQSFYYKMTASQIEELMGCLVLEVGEHIKYHRYNRKGDINDWLSLYNSEENREREIINYLPFAWLSETNYNLFIKWICDTVDNMKPDLFVSYKMFIERNTLPVTSDNQDVVYDDDDF